MRPSLFVLGVLAVALAPAGCARSPLGPAPVHGNSAPSLTTYDDAGLSLFVERKVAGSFVLLDLATGTSIVVGRDDAARGHVPCSTYKIPNTLIGLETGVIPDEHFTLKWDGKKRWVDEWNRDHDLASAMKYSVVWYYQEVARRVGEARMKEWLHAFRYGNESTEGGIDRFWLDEDVADDGQRRVGGLRISALQQVELLRRLRVGELPVSREHAALVTRILPSVRVGDVDVRGKTGLGEMAGHTIGWMVGYAERGDRTWVYATHIDAPEVDYARMMPLRRELTHALLARYGVVRTSASP